MKNTALQRLTTKLKISLKLALAGAVAGVLAAAAVVQAELPAERVPNVATLPADYPETWIFAHDANFDALIAGRVVILDVAAETKEYKGALDAAHFATFIESAKHGELYVGETHYSRGTRGERTDTIAIYDKATLEQKAEIILPGRALIVTNKYAMQLTGDEKFLLVFNFTPAASVSVVDIAKREVVGEIDVAGCSMIYPTGDRAFASLCGDGSLFYVQLNADGKVSSDERYKPFFDVDKAPLFDKPAYADGVAYFPDFKGGLQPIDMTRKPRLLRSWELVGRRDKKENWMPSGWQIIATDENGMLYVLMRKNSGEGTHKSGGEEVWVYDPKKRKRIRRIELETMGFSIELTADSNPLLVVTNVMMGIDVYEPDGTLLRSIGGAAAMPIILHRKKR